MFGPKPKDFQSHPYDSVKQSSEAETVARNIMVILGRKGNKFRLLKWDEYKKERQKDGNFSDAERNYFNQVVGFCSNADSAKNFSPAWADVG